jgi:hypothetical protein
MKINKVIVWDINLPPSINKFSKEFISIQISSLLDIFLGYNQVSLVKDSRNLTAFITLLGLY